MDRFITIMRKEFLHILRDARTLAMILLLPGLLLVLLGYGVSGASENVPLAVVDYSRTSTSQEYVDNYTASGDFDLVAMPLNENDLLEMMDMDQVDVGLIIPEDFGRNLDTGKTSTVQLYINGSTEPTEAQTIQLKIGAISQAAMQDVLVDQLMRSPDLGGVLEMPIDTRTKMLYNPEGDGGMFMIPGLIAILLQVQALLLSALAIVREREQGTMEQLIVTPLKKWELMMGKIIPYLLVNIFNTVVMLWLGDVIFGVKVVGSYLGACWFEHSFYPRLAGDGGADLEYFPISDAGDVYCYVCGAYPGDHPLGADVLPRWDAFIYLLVRRVSAGNPFP